MVKHKRICSRLTPLTGTWSVQQFVRICVDLWFIFPDPIFTDCTLRRCAQIASFAKGRRPSASRQLPVGFVDTDGDGVCQIEAPGVCARHRDLEELFAIAFIKGLRKPASLAPENQRVARLERKFVQGTFAVRTEEKEPRRSGRGEKILPRVVDGQTEVRPVVQPRTFHIMVGQMKSKRADQVKAAVQTDAKASDGTGVVRDFRVDKHDVKIGHGGTLSPDCLPVRWQAVRFAREARAEVSR